MRILISGGGTGGHVFPAISIAQAIQKIHPETTFLFVGAQGKIEMEKVPKAGFNIEGLWISGFHRKLTLRNLLFPVKLVASFFKAYQIIRKFKPDCVVGVGGYASGPTLYIASKRGLKCIIQEQNSFPGITNKILSIYVNKICVAYPNLDKFFPKDKIIFTGNPVRKSIFDKGLKKEDPFDIFGIDKKKKTILVIGGSLGARSINNYFKKSTDLIKDNPGVQILWQTGKLYEEDLKNCETQKLKNVVMTTFIDRMDLAYSCADIIISRAGAGTISELCLVQKPCIFVPSPNVAEDHQTHNAMSLVNSEAAILVKDSELDVLLPTAYKLLEDTDQQRKLAENIFKLAKPNADVDIANIVIDLVDN